MSFAVPPSISHKPKIVLLGMMTRMPVAGVVWQTMQYVVGLERLGYEVYYVEAHAMNPSMLMDSDDEASGAKAAAFVAGVMNRFGLGDRWAYLALHEDGECYGLSVPRLRHLYRSADLIINLHGGTEPAPEHYESGRLIYLETDPVQVQIELHDNDAQAIAYLEPHIAFFTYGENLGRPGCRVPVSDRFTFLPTRQPIISDWWPVEPTGIGEAFTSIGNWRQQWRDVWFGGETYHWSKHHEFMKFLDLPSSAPNETFELALASFQPEDREMLEAHGWHVERALDFSMDVDRYRAYVGASKGEFTVAKDQNVRLQSGWFSDRSASYLAAGRPVVNQDTGFSAILPTGEGLFSFNTVDDVVAAIDAINTDYERHRRAAREIVREYFEYDRVLGDILEAVDLPRHAGKPARRDPEPLPEIRSDAGLVRLNWGCGDHGEAGWINSDLKDGDGIQLVGDIRDGLPVEDETFDYIVSIHALPMISLPDVVPVLEELRRVLKPGGVLRMCLPDLERGIRAYLDGDREYFVVPDEDAESAGGKLITQLLWYGWTVTMFTRDFIEELLLRAGFREVHQCEYQQSKCDLPGITELDNREQESLYVEAVA